MLLKSKSSSTSKDLARAAGVSQATVSRVFRGLDNVKAETREKVLLAARTIDYRPNALARAMRTSRIGVIGVVVARLNNPLYIDILRALNAALVDQELRVVLWDTEGAGEIAAIDAIRQSLVDGVIFAAATRTSSVLEEAIQASAPLVLINRTVDGLSCDQVSSDNAAGGAGIASYFLDHCRRRIGYITGSAEASTIRDREEGFLEALSRRGSGIETSLIRRVDFSHEAGRKAMHSLLDLADPPDAVFCVNDLLAFGALDGAFEAGCRVPEDCWVVGFDDVEQASWATLSLTTVRQPIRSIVEDGVALLLERLSDPTLEPRCIVHPVDLMVRRSTGRSRIPANNAETKGNTQ